MSHFSASVQPSPPCPANECPHHLDPTALTQLRTALEHFIKSRQSLHLSQIVLIVALALALGWSLCFGIRELWVILGLFLAFSLGVTGKTSTELRRLQQAITLLPDRALESVWAYVLEGFYNELLCEVADGRLTVNAAVLSWMQIPPYLRTQSSGNEVEQLKTAGENAYFHHQPEEAAWIALGAVIIGALNTQQLQYELSLDEIDLARFVIPILDDYARAGCPDF